MAGKWPITIIGLMLGTVNTVHGLDFGFAEEDPSKRQSSSSSGANSSGGKNYGRPVKVSQSIRKCEKNTMPLSAFRKAALPSRSTNSSAGITFSPSSEIKKVKDGKKDVYQFEINLPAYVSGKNAQCLDIRPFAYVVSDTNDIAIGLKNITGKSAKEVAECLSEVEKKAKKSGKGYRYLKNEGLLASAVKRSFTLSVPAKSVDLGKKVNVFFQSPKDDKFALAFKGKGEDALGRLFSDNRKVPSGNSCVYYENISSEGPLGLIDSESATMNSFVAACKNGDLEKILTMSEDLENGAFGKLSGAVEKILESALESLWSKEPKRTVAELKEITKSIMDKENKHPDDIEDYVEEFKESLGKARKTLLDPWIKRREALMVRRSAEKDKKKIKEIDRKIYEYTKKIAELGKAVKFHGDDSTKKKLSLSEISKGEKVDSNRLLHRLSLWGYVDEAMSAKEFQLDAYASGGEAVKDLKKALKKNGKMADRAFRLVVKKYRRSTGRKISKGGVRPGSGKGKNQKLLTAFETRAESVQKFKETYFDQDPSELIASFKRQANASKYGKTLSNQYSTYVKRLQKKCRNPWSSSCRGAQRSYNRNNQYYTKQMKNARNYYNESSQAIGMNMQLLTSGYANAYGEYPTNDIVAGWTQGYGPNPMLNAMGQGRAPGQAQQGQNSSGFSPFGQPLPGQGLPGFNQQRQMQNNNPMFMQQGQMMM